MTQNKDFDEFKQKIPVSQFPELELPKFELPKAELFNIEGMLDFGLDDLLAS